MKISTNDILVQYELSGNPAGDVIVLGHSLGSSSIMWNPQIKLLSDNYRVLRYDTRGHGGSDAPPGSYSMDLLVSDAISMLDALEIEQVHWVGLSMGGMIGQGLALKAPARLKSLVLCNTMSVVREDTREMWRSRIRSGERFGMQHLVDFAMERWFTESYRAGEPSAYLEIRDQFLATPVYGYVGCCHAIYNLNYVDQLSRIDMPTHIIAGDQDLATPAAESRVMHEQISGSSMEVIKGAAHLSNVEKSQDFNRSLMSFLRSV